MTKSLTVVAVILVMTGCRNTTNTPIAPFGASTPLSPLSPVQGTASLSPIQPVSGMSTFGAPTRVPPPPTGSYNSPGNYGASSNYMAPTSNYAPGGMSPSGAALGSSGLTRGLTDLRSPNVPLADAGYDNGVRQTSWVGSPPAAGDSYSGNAFGNGFDPRLQPAEQALPINDPSTGPRSGGMPVIDLTRSPYPPGYVPPQNRPGVGAFPTTAQYPQAQYPQAQYPQAMPQSQFNSAPIDTAPANSVPLGQPSNSTFVRSGTANGGMPGFDSGSFDSAQSVQMASRTGNSILPSTEPFNADNAATADELQWRRPSPRF
ncbi:MAG: hypothetical protein KDB00_03490 [Planctomycetales bacterium]|nr:hypothetical protein [Planctomycetales bacterium]